MLMLAIFLVAIAVLFGRKTAAVLAIIATAIGAAIYFPHFAIAILLVIGALIALVVTVAYAIAKHAGDDVN